MRKRQRTGTFLGIASAPLTAPKNGEPTMSPKSYRSFQEFEREEIRPYMKVGFTMEDFVEESSFDGELNFDADYDPFECDD